MILTKEIFNRVYAKYARRDYFSHKGYIRLMIKQNSEKLPEYKLKVSYGNIKAYLKHNKEKSFSSSKVRLEEYPLKVYPKREKFTWELINLTLKEKMI